MSRLVGRLSSLELSTNIPVPSWKLLGGAVDLSMSIAQAEITMTSHDDASWEDYLAGRKDVTIDCSLRYNEADDGQKLILGSIFATTEADRLLKLRFRMQTATGAHNFEAVGFVSSVSPSGPNDDAAGFDASFRMSSSIAKTAQ